MSQPIPDRTQVQAALQQAQLAFNQGNFDVAEPIYAQYMQLIPPESEEYALCLHNLGEISEQKGNVPNAIWCQTRLLTHGIMKHMSMAPHLLSRMGHLATLYEKTGQNNDAQTIYRQMHDFKDQAAAMEGKAPPPPITSELTTFLLTLLDNAHRKFSQDPMQINSTRRAFESLQPVVAPTADNPVSTPAPVGGWVNRTAPADQQISGSQPQQPDKNRNMASTKLEMPAQNVSAQPTPQPTPQGQAPAPAGPRSGNIQAPQFDLSGYTAHQQETGRFFPKQMEHLQQTSQAPPAAQHPVPAQHPVAAQPVAAPSPQPDGRPRTEQQSWESGWNNPPVDEVPELFEKEDPPPPVVQAPVIDDPDPRTKKRELVPKEDQKGQPKKNKPPQPKKVQRHLETKGPMIVPPVNFSGPSSNKPAAPAKNVSVGPPQFLPPTSYKPPKARKPKEFKRDSLMTIADVAPKAAPAKRDSKPDWTEQIKSAGSPKKGGDKGKGGAPQEQRGGGGGARGRLSFDMGGGGLDAPQSDGNEEFSNMMGSVTKLMNNKLAPVAIGLFVSVIFIVVIALPYRLHPADVFKSMPRNFNTVDEGRAINFASLGDTELRSGSTKAHIAFRYFLGDWREAIGLAFAPLGEKQYWINDVHDTIDKQDVHAYLKDEAGNIFYPISAPELKTKRSMEEIARKLGEWYLKHFLKYPKDATEFTGGELNYENAVTHAKEQADWQSPIIIGSRESAREANYKRAQFYEDLTKGKGWENERKLAPGSINCCAVTFLTPGGNYQGLILRGGDHKGEPIKGSNSGEGYYVAWEDNKPKIDKLPPLPFLGDGTMRKKEIVIFEEPVSSSFTFMVKTAAGWLFVGLAFFGGCIYLALPKKSKYKSAAIVWIGFNAIMATLYTLAPRL